MADPFQSLLRGVAERVVASGLDDFRVEDLPVPAHAEAQHDMTTQPSTLGGPRIVLVAFQALEYKTQVRLNGVLLLFGNALVLGRGDCRYESKPVQQSAQGSIPHRESPPWLQTSHKAQLQLEFCILPSTRSRLSQDSLNL